MSERYYMMCPECKNDFTVNSDSDELGPCQCPYCGYQLSGENVQPPTLGINVEDGVRAGEELR